LIRKGLGAVMPICTNPNCGEISKSKTRFCPHCGQESLSYLSKSELGNLSNPVLTTETFELEIASAIGPKEPSSKRKRDPLYLFRIEGKKQLSVKELFIFVFIVILFGLLIFDAAPAPVKDSLLQRVGLQEKFSLDFKENEMQFKFIQINDNGIPTYFKGCGSIDYYVRQNYASEEDISLLAIAFSSVGSGIQRTFKFKGFTQERDVSALPNSILIDFASTKEFEEIQDKESESDLELAGLGSPRDLVRTDKPRINSWTATKGQVSINQDAWESMDVVSKQILLMHEVGHVLGLDHPKNGENQVMDRQDYYGPELGSGDLMGMRILSALAGCRDFPDYLTGKGTLKADSSDESSSGPQKKDVYSINDTKLGEVKLIRSEISSATDSCGNSFPESVQKLDKQIPVTWVLQEDNGCGSGSSYTWTNPENSGQVIFLQFSSSVGWCQGVDPNDVELIAVETIGDVKEIKRSDDYSGRYIYGYLRATSEFSQRMLGVLEVGSAYDWCSTGTRKLEVSVKIHSDENLFDGIVTSFYDTY
jgi:hypothetical protein